MVSITNGAIEVGTKRVPLIAGEVHYWRLERQHWARALDRVKEMGVRIVSSYIPWSVHEMRPGHFDFGEYDPRKDVAGFLKLIAERELYFFARPGPHINAEITYFGYPKRIVADESLWSRSSGGAPITVPSPPRFFPALSYAHDRLFEEFGVYLDALCPILVEHQQPDGPIVAIQPDNEMSGFFRTGAYDHDYSDAARAQFARFLENKYGNAAELGAVYNKTIERFADVPMPTRFEADDIRDLPAALDWMEYKEYALEEPLARIHAMFRERNLTRLLTYHNLPVAHAWTPFNVPSMERELNFVGVDFYVKKEQAATMRTRVRRLAGQSRLPTIPEYGAGCYLWWPPTGIEDEKFTLPYAILHGIRGFNLYMLVERERWYGSPILPDGSVREPHFTHYKNLHAAIARTGLFEMERLVQVGVCRMRDYDRLEKASTLLSPLPPLVFDDTLSAEMLCDERSLGLSRCVQIDHAQQLRGWQDVLDSARVPYDLPDTDASDLLSRYKLLICPTFEFAGRRAQDTLIRYAEAGGTVVIGPDVPELDERMHEATILGRHTKRPVEKLLDDPVCVAFDVGDGRIVLATGPLPGAPVDADHWSHDLIGRLLKSAGVERPPTPADRKIETMLFRSKERSILMAANPTGKERVAELPVGLGKLTDAITGETFRSAEVARVPMEPHNVRILEMGR